MNKNSKDLYKPTDYKKAWGLVKNRLKGFVPVYLYKKIEIIMQECLDKIKDK